jgi:hypothetical protein
MGYSKKPRPVKLKVPKKHVGPSRGAQFIWAAAGALLGNILVPGVGGFLGGGAIGGALALTGKEKKIVKIPVFYSFHFANDVMRVQQIRNIGTIEGNSAVNANDWERLKRSGKAAVKKWIDENMKYKRCVIVLIGSETASRPWVKYEIERAWNQGKSIIGIHIHNIKCARNGVCRKGANPFDDFTLDDGRKLSSVVPCYDPDPSRAYHDIAANISGWINQAIDNKWN